MPDTYAGNNVFPSTITIPKGGESASSASVNVGFEGLADRTAYLKAIKDAEDGRPIRNLQDTIAKDTGGSALAFNHKRGDGTSTAFYSTTYGIWVKCGVDTAGHVFLGDRDQWGDYNTAASSPPKVSFGCDSAIGINPGRVAVFNGDLKTTGGGVDPKYILGPASGDFTGTWTTKSLDTIGTFISYVRAYDCVVTPTQRVIVSGGGDLSGAGQFLVWKSDDFGNSFTRVTVANVSASQDVLNRVIVGKNGRLVSWVKTSSANQGNKLFYSDDDGNTWSSRSAIGFDQIVDGVYLADLDLWAFAGSGPTIYTTPDPVVGAFTPNPIGFAPAAMGGFGHYLMYSQHMSTVRDDLYFTADPVAFNVSLAGRDPRFSGSQFTNIAAAPFGQLLISSDVTLTFTDRL